MAFNDFLKKAKESAQSAAGTAKAKFDEQKQKSAEQKAERERIRAEKQAQADAKTQEMLEALQASSGDLFCIDRRQLLDFTADYYDKLFLPAHSISASKIIFHPLDQKIVKYAKKEFTQYSESEEPVFMVQGKSQQKVFLSTQALYFKKAFDEEASFFCIGRVPIECVESVEYKLENEKYVFLCNGIELMSGKDGLALDIDTFRKYIERIKNRDYVITNEQIDEEIKEKIGSEVLKIVREYIYEDELLLYFAWGCDSLTAKDFVVCSDKQMVVLDREAFGLTKNVKQFYYEDVTSMATLQETNGLLDLALTAALSVCDLEISVAGAKERLKNLYTYEAEKAVKVYRECRRAAKEEASRPQVVMQAAPAQDDPIAQLEKLSKLKEAGIISEDEFNAKKADLLGKL